jgi:pimeloyl-ACP methyl ester carboxylesterase
MTRVALNGHPTWVRVAKKRAPTLVLLHGGMSSSASLLRSVGPGLAKFYRIAAFDRRGHGRTADTAEPFHYDSMAEETVAFLEYLGRPAHLVGHSDGAIVALLVAKRRPDLVRRVVAVGANYHYDALLEKVEFPMEGPVFERWAKRYGASSPDGAAHAPIVIQKTLQLSATEPTMMTADLAAIAVPVLVMSSDDEPFGLDHVVSMYQTIPGAELAIMPGTSHSMFKERPGACVRIIHHFLTSPWPPVTEAPLRRRPPS